MSRGGHRLPAEETAHSVAADRAARAELPFHDERDVDEARRGLVAVRCWWP